VERQVAWRYWPMTDLQYSQAIEEIEQQACAVRSFER
jgi:hypothetical protein